LPFTFRVPLLAWTSPTDSRFFRPGPRQRAALDCQKKTETTLLLPFFYALGWFCPVVHNVLYELVGEAEDGREPPRPEKNRRRHRTGRTRMNEGHPGSSRRIL
jgi:hypothetical protein